MLYFQKNCLKRVEKAIFIFEVDSFCKKNAEVAQW